MATLDDKIGAEFEQIELSLSLIPEDFGALSALELAGLGSVLHSIYNGVENILKQVFRAEGIALPEGAFWHKDLLSTASERGVIGKETFALLKEYAAFRHFFVHAYGPQLDVSRIRPLIEKVCPMLCAFRNDLAPWYPAD